MIKRIILCIGLSMSPLVGSQHQANTTRISMPSPIKLLFSVLLLSSAHITGAEQPFACTDRATCFPEGITTEKPSTTTIPYFKYGPRLAGARIDLGEAGTAKVIDFSDGGGNITYRPFIENPGGTHDITLRTQYTVKCKKGNVKCIERLPRYLKLGKACSCGIIHPERECEHRINKSYLHPFIWRGNLPYEQGDGGLLNPKLVFYSMQARNLKGEDFVGVTTKLTMKVKSDSIAGSPLNDVGHAKQHDPLDEYLYANPILEEIVLGFLKERLIDRQGFDLTAGLTYADHFIECVKQEWTSKKSADDTSKLSLDCQDLMRRHLPYSVYWPSQWNDGQRFGEYERISIFKTGEDDNLTGVSLDALDISVTKHVVP